MKPFLNLLSVTATFLLIPIALHAQGSNKISTKVKGVTITDNVQKELVKFYGQEAVDSLLLPKKTETYYIFDWYMDDIIQEQLRLLEEFDKLPNHVVGSSGLVSRAFLPGTNLTDVDRWETGFFSFGLMHFGGTPYMSTINSDGVKDWQFDVDYRIVSGDTLYLGLLWRDSDTLVLPKSEHFDDGVRRARRFIMSARDAMHRVNEKYPQR
jgi:hypothetical protein